MPTVVYEANRFKGRELTAFRAGGVSN